MALLSKGAVLERMGRVRAAARVYADALKLAPPPARTPPAFAEPLARARAVVAANRAALAETLHAAAGVDAPSRLAEAARVFAGVTRAYVPEPTLFHYPGLPIAPFFDRALFPWLPALESATATIAAELAAAEARTDGFEPYVTFPPGVPQNQWSGLNNNRDWSAFYLWRDGVRFDAACAACPATSAVIEQLPLLRQQGFGPTVMFSRLAARTAIPPHTGSANTRSVCHLPLVLPGPAWFRVGNDRREWRMGEAWVFDDTIEHEAANEADAARTILIIDLWNPYLTAAEQRGVEAMMLARRTWYAGES